MEDFCSGSFSACLPGLSFAIISIIKGFFCSWHIANEIILPIVDILDNLWPIVILNVLITAYSIEAYDTPPLHSPQDPLIYAVCSLTTHVTRASYPDAHLVEILPFLNDLPQWIPGVNWSNRWKKEAGDAYERYTEGFEGIYGKAEERVRREGENGDRDENGKNEGKGSFARKLVRHKPPTPIDQDRSSLVSGEDTVNTMAWLLIILAKYRDVQAKAAAEIHAYLASTSISTPTSTNASASASLSSPLCLRLPTPTDHPNLPYCRAVLHESMRWRPVDPLGLPHMCVEDDVYVCADAESGASGNRYP
ncbi:hypothetical protein D9758_004448 [Tetrapyrgos nigripes]|uniref:Cytochrome P450 n=1 Tax=Tetrapyrgos nigripes TaxID=182062 RepID=A0A8H5LS25_9AGAR|nr:hypothetical protein D9758_004448 [Tetrapyrgos nigripes]